MREKQTRGRGKGKANDRDDVVVPRDLAQTLTYKPCSITNPKRQTLLQRAP